MCFDVKQGLGLSNNEQKFFAPFFQKRTAFFLAYNGTIFLSAFLLFSVQPMVSRMVLPRLGGAPAVWNTCVCFFQAVLLLGYAYADISATFLGQRGQLIVHAAVLLTGLVLMPLSIAPGVPGPHAIPAFWLIGRLSVSIGPAFLALSATAPLLQHWFARSAHPRAQDPYFLYAASNSGSLLALICTPLVLETLFGLHFQTRLWSDGLALCAAMVLGCGLMVRGQGARHPAAARLPESGLIPASLQCRWMALAFVPSGLMLAVTTYITTDIAAAPLFWVIPLTIYILTFMLAFGRTRRAMPRHLPAAQAVALAVAGVAALMGVPNLLALFVALVVFSLTATVCHLLLAASRPDPAHLTRYFLLISIGGALGGVFNALVAPMLFSGPWEYPLLLIAACAMRPAPPAPHAAARERPGFLRLLAIVCAGAALIYAASPAAPAALRTIGPFLGVALPGAALIWLSRRGTYLGIGLAGLLVMPLIVRSAGAAYSTRSFFGTYRVLQFPAEHLRILQHGTTVHGVQSDLAGEAETPLGYYSRSGPFGRLFADLHKGRPSLGAVGVIGLGAGALACYAAPGETWLFREIDPAIERMARASGYFHFLKLCGNAPRVVIGDARVTLTQDVAARYNLLIVDAFSSDSVPAHLLTREALALYLAHLSPGGIVVYHISNRYLDLAPIVARTALDAGGAARHLLLGPSGEALRNAGAELIAVAPAPASLDGLAADGWDVPKPGPVLWTDDRSDIARVIRW